ncbi:alpha/beta hydrolase [Polaribacter ponticola]|uniref:Alpha/beta hydrolase n=1 Tax=Polaribacter ponticola TaxID=2978475 RepID=A0ABT5SA90_9FLAO|nr:alpha/beta hydrolase [Polaribacter sp. MSW5]MDD7914222.1 alpha/beta hydrolase [Polaribacter sp. MSW5]
MTKIPIYFMPGLAAGPKIFENLDLSKEHYELFYLEWKKPLAIEESITNYAMRMSEDINHKNPVLVGVSFGGIIVQEISKFIETRKVIIISSVKTKHELPTRFKISSMSKLYKLFPTKIVNNFESYAKFFLGKSLKKRADIYKKYLSVRGTKYLKWSIHNVLHWSQEKPLTDIIHIHGTEDHVFPYKNIKNPIKIEEGTHVMILTKAKKISQIIHESLT